MTKAFSEQEKAKSVLNGRRTDPLNEPALNALHSLLLKFTGIQSRLRALDRLLEDLRSKRTTDLQFLL